MHCCTPRCLNKGLNSSLLNHLQVGAEDVRQQLEAAVSAEKFDEADALQEELTATAAEADSLAAEHGFESADMQDLQSLLAPTTPKSAGWAIHPPQLGASPDVNPLQMSSAQRDSCYALVCEGQTALHG